VKPIHDRRKRNLRPAALALLLIGAAAGYVSTFIFNWDVGIGIATSCIAACILFWFTEDDAAER
jgi:hypothetical protein